jgi:hypothetical protein
MPSTYIKRTFASTTNRKTFTYSVWVKRGAVNAEVNMLSSGNFSGDPYLDARFNVDGTLEWYHYTTGFNFRLKTDRQFKDVSGWYHLVFAVDTTQSTASNRCKLYVNGVQETSFSNEQYPSQDYDMAVNYSGYQTSFGSLRDSAVTYDGSMSHIHFIDGTAYDASAFGSTDATTGEWKINTTPSVTYGTNGFFVLKDGNSVTDQSGNSNNLTVAGGTLTKTEDCPSNVFATGNRLYYYNGAYADWSNGNNTCYTNSGATGVQRTTLGASSGKYYWEVKIGASDGAGNIWQGVGIMGEPQTNSTDELGDKNFGYGYWGQDGSVRNNDSNIASYSTFTTNDIISVALDMNNNKLYFAKNGTWQNSANPSSGSNGISINANPTDGFYFPAWGDWDNNNRYYFYLNFGNGYFGTTAVASAGTNASGIGVFEYDVPTGYTALSTKGLNE